MPTTHTLKVEDEKSSSSSQGRTERPSGAAAFALDTSGGVYMPEHMMPGRLEWQWSDLDPFTQGYVEAMAPSSSTDGASWHLSWPRDDHYSEAVGFSDLAPETLAAILKDCAARVAGWHAANSPVRSDDRTEGARFWRDRQAGLCADFPPLTVSLGDDGKVRAFLAKQEG